MAEAMQSGMPLKRNFEFISVGVGNTIDATVCATVSLSGEVLLHSFQFYITQGGRGVVSGSRVGSSKLKIRI